MRKMFLVAVLVIVVSVLLSPWLQACESCSDEYTCLPTWSGASSCTWTEKCRIIGTYPFQSEICWSVCKQYDFTCVVKPHGEKPAV
jgi:hypothetical protein